MFFCISATLVRKQKVVAYPWVKLFNAAKQLTDVKSPQKVLATDYGFLWRNKGSHNGTETSPPVLVKPHSPPGLSTNIRRPKE